MNLRKHMRAHETDLNAALLEGSPSHDWQRTFEQHLRITRDMQHERLVHLLVTLFFTLFLLITIGFVLLSPSRLLLILAALFFIMLIPYIAHYFFLENTIQRWYLQTDRLETLRYRSDPSFSTNPSPPVKNTDHPAHASQKIIRKDITGADRHLSG